MHETTPPLPGLSPVNGKAVTARFDGGSLSSDAGLLALREVERRLDVAGRLAACVDDPRDPNRTLHSVTDILRFFAVVDDFTRECLALIVDTSVSGARVVRELEKIAELRGRPCMIVSDNATEL